MGVNDLIKKYYLNKPGWINGTVQFKKLIESRINSESEILDIGASRNSQHNYKGFVRKIVGIDISEDVLSNPNLDEAYQCCVTKMPFEDNCFDLAFADYVLEHLDDPIKAAREICRVLKPDGVLVIRVPNLWHYVILISNMTPHWFHVFIRKKLQGTYEEDAFKTYYRCNTRRQIKKVFKEAGFIIEHLEMIEKEPSYLMKWNFIFMLGLFYERLVNSTTRLEGFRSNVFAVFRKSS
jgi:SAM-dependent methyltransferase